MNKYLIVTLAFLVATSGFAQISEKDSILQMEEVQIQGIQNAFKYKNGNIKVEVANSILSSVANPLDLLSKLPKVQISGDRNLISIVGKGNPLLYLDNQKIEVNDLLALSVSDIKSIEIIHNPSAKYEAEGRAVILITRKISASEGFQTSISETASFKKRFNNYLGINSNFSFKTTEIKANFNYNKLNPWESNANSYEIPAFEIISDYNVAGFTNRNNYVYGTGIYHTFANTDTFSLSLNGHLKEDDFDFKTKTNHQFSNQLSEIETEGRTRGNRNFVNSFLNYNKKIKANATLFLGLQYSSFVNALRTNSSNNYNQTSFSPFQSVNQYFKVEAFSERIDFEKKFDNLMNLEIGALHTYANANTNLLLNNFETNNNSNSTYNLKEQNTSGYMQLSGIIKKVSWSSGIRAENTNVNGKYGDANAAKISKNYTYFFPKGQIDFAIDSTKTVTFNYAKTITRPDYSSTSNGQTAINPYFVFSSNINLNPAIGEEVSANFQYKNKSITVGYYTNKNVMNYGFQYNEDENVLNYRPENFDLETGYNIEFSYPFKYRFWTSNTTLSLNLSKYEDQSFAFSDAKPYLYYYSNQTFTLKEDWTLSFVAWGLTNRSEGIFQRKNVFVLDSAISKKFKNWTCTLSYNNIFKGGEFEEKIQSNLLNSQAVFFQDTNEFAIALRYTFGKAKPSTFKEKQVDENVNRIR